MDNDLSRTGDANNNPLMDIDDELPGQAVETVSLPPLADSTSLQQHIENEPATGATTTTTWRLSSGDLVVPTSAVVVPVSATMHHQSLHNASAKESREGDRMASQRRSSATASLSRIGLKAISKNGIIATVIYVILATMLAVSTYGLESMANEPIHLGVVEQAWDHDIFDIPITTFMQGTTTIQAIEKTVLPQTQTYGTQSLSDLQYDTCGVRDWACADKVKPNTEIVFYRLATAFSLISGFAVPEFAAAPEKIELKYVNTLSGYNFPVVQFHIPGVAAAVVCSVRRNRYRVAQEVDSKGDIDSVAICSKRPYDPNWMCENEVAKDVVTYIIKIKQGKVTYLGATLRSELYYNPGNIAKLTGSAQGTGLLSTVIGIDEYNGGILQSSAPWDMAPAYLCQGTFDPATYVGMRWQGQGVVSMTWTSSSLMATNSFVLWSVTMSLAVIQFIYLPKSSVCVIPVNMAKTAVGPLILAFACYGNYNVQVLTTYLNLNKVTSFDATPYRLAGPIMFSSVISIMSGTAIQMFFSPLLVSPSYILTLVSVVNWLVVFVLEAFVFPKASVMLIRECGLASSTTCSFYSATVKNYYLSPLIGACAVGFGILVVFNFQRHATKPDLPPSNSVLKLFRATTVRHLATSGAGGCVVPGPDGIVLVDAGILLNKNLVRVSKTVLVRSCVVKYVILYRLLPPVFARSLSRAVGVTLVLKAKEDRVTRDVAFLELKDMKLARSQYLPGYYS